MGVHVHARLPQHPLTEVAGGRILAESIARNRWPRGVHVAYVTLDAVIGLAWTRQMHADKPDDFFLTFPETAWLA